MNRKIYNSVYFAVFALCCILNQDAFAQPTFSAKTDFTTGSGPWAVAAGDLNGDGKPDMVIANYNASTLSVFLNTTPAGNAAPTFSAKTDFTTGSGPTSVTIGDFNGDGKPDMAVTNSSANSVSVFLNTTTPGASTPTFSAKTDFTTVSQPWIVLIGDFNGDGKPDMAAANSGTNSVSVYLNTTTPGASTPTFSAKTDFTTGSSSVSYGVSIGDLNGDGKPDMAASNYVANSVSVFLNTTTPGASTPTFTAKTDFTTGTSPSGASIGDLNGDGKPDLATTNENSTSVSVLLNTTPTGNATPTFSSKTDFIAGTIPSVVSIYDINDDGKPDMAVANSNSTSVSVFLNTTTPGATTPTFTAKTDFTTGTTTTSVSICDLNGDGKPDMAATNYSSTNVSVFFNTMTLGEPAPSFTAKTDFTSGNSPLSISIADFNKDGKPDFVTANNSPNTVSVILNTTTTGAVAPTFSAKTDFATGNGTYAVTTGDFNGDGIPDIAEVSYGSNTVSVFLNSTTPGASTPTFAASVDFSMGIGAVSVTIGDFNGDGKQDFASVSTNAVSVFLNTTAPGATTPTFSARTDFAVGTVTYSVATGDFNGDGKLDMVTANLGSNTVSVLLNTTTTGASTPTFSTKTDFMTGDQPFRVSVGDLNGDGKPDVVCADVNTNLVSVFLNITAPGASTAALTAKTDFTTGLNPASVSISDINGDGKPDLIIPSNAAATVSVLLNITTPGSTTPAFTAKTDFTTAAGAFASAVADFNGDGLPDIIVTDNDANSVSVFFNTADLPLPVELASFSSSVISNNVTLNWSTAQEQNNKGFEIERNSFGAGWNKVGFIAGRGTTTIAQSYSFSENGLNSGRYSYRLKQIDYNGNYKYYELQNEVVIGVPNKFVLNQNYPNPFNPSTVLSFQLPVAGFVSMKIFDMSGREVASLVNEVKDAGYYSVTFDVKSLSSGTYFYKLSTDKFSDVKKMVVVK